MSAKNLVEALRAVIEADDLPGEIDHREAMSAAVRMAATALAERKASAFSDDVADMVERAGAILRSRVCSITQAEKLVAFMRAAHNLANHAFENPAYQEPME